MANVKTCVGVQGGPSTSGNVLLFSQTTDCGTVNVPGTVQIAENGTYIATASSILYTSANVSSAYSVVPKSLANEFVGEAEYYYQLPPLPSGMYYFNVQFSPVVGYADGPGVETLRVVSSSGAYSYSVQP